jgi:hypothetical protein
MKTIDNCPATANSNTNANINWNLYINKPNKDNLLAKLYFNSQ